MEFRKSIISKYFLSVFFFVSCKSSLTPIVLEDFSIQVKNKSLTSDELENWQHKDIIEDTIPGVSLDRLYGEIIKRQRGREVIVAVIDTRLDIYHEFGRISMKFQGIILMMIKMDILMIFTGGIFWEIIKV